MSQVISYKVAISPSCIPEFQLRLLLTINLLHLLQQKVSHKYQPVTPQQITRCKPVATVAGSGRHVLLMGGFAKKLAVVRIQETEKSLDIKITRSGFVTAHLLQCLEAIEADHVRLAGQASRDRKNHLSRQVRPSAPKIRLRRAA